MTDQFHLDASGLTPLSDLQSQAAQGLSQLASEGGPQAADVAKSFGNIAFGLNSALGGASQSRLGAMEATKTSAETIADLLKKAHQMYMQGDQQGGDKLTAAAEAMEGSSGPGSAGGSTGAGSGAGGGAAGAGPSAGGGAEMASQMASQVGQQVGQLAQGLAQSVQGLTQGLTQLPQQIMQGIDGIGGSVTKGAGSDAGAAHEAAKANEEKVGEDKDVEHKDKDAKPDDGRAKERREQQPHADSAHPGRAADGGRAPVPPPATERPLPPQTRPQQSPL